MWTEPRAGAACTWTLVALLGGCQGSCGETGAPGTIVFHQGDPPVLCAVAATGGAPVCEEPTGRFAGPSTPDGQALAIIETRETDGMHEERLARWTAPGAPVTALTPWAPQVRDPAFSPDGAHLAVATTLGGVSTLFTLPAAGSTSPGAVHDHPGGSFEPTWTAEGDLIFASSRDGNAELYRLPEDAGTNVTPERLTDHPYDDLRPRVSRGGRLAWISDRDGHRRVFVFGPDGVPMPLLERLSPQVDLSWSPVDERLAVIFGDGPDHSALLLVDGTTGRILDTIRHGNGAYEHPAWSPDGRWLALTCRPRFEPSTLCLVDTRDGTRSELRLPPDAEAIRWLPRWLAVPAPLGL